MTFGPSGIVYLISTYHLFTAGYPHANFTVQELDTLNLAIVDLDLVTWIFSTMNMFFDDMQWMQYLQVRHYKKNLGYFICLALSKEC